MKKVLLLSLFIALFAGCKKEEPYPKTDYFYGKWRIIAVNLDMEFIASGVINTIYRNQGTVGNKVDVLGTGTWTFDENSKNLKIKMQTWTSPGLYDPFPGGSSMDAIIDVVDANNFYLNIAGSIGKFTKVP